MIDFEGLAGGTTLSTQYSASLGVTFSGGFKICPRSFFGFLAPPYSDKLLCGYASSAGTIYEPTGGDAARLQMSFAFPVNRASIEFRTGVPSPPSLPDSDQIVLIARDAWGNIVAQQICSASNASSSTEGVGTCIITAPGIRSLEVEDGDADSLDTLWLSRQCEPLEINFDSSPAGTPGHLTLIDEQYAAWGIHFNNAFYVAQRTVSFPFYKQAPLTFNMLCTFAGSSANPNCLAPLPPVPGGNPAKAKLVVSFDWVVYGGAIEGRTAVGMYDVDQISISAFTGVDGTGTPVGSVQGYPTNNQSPYSVEGIARPEIRLSTATIRSLVIDDGDADALDSLIVYTCR